MRAMPGGTVGATGADITTRFVLGAALGFAFFLTLTLGEALVFAFFLTLGLDFCLGAVFFRPTALRAGTFLVFFFALVFAFFLAAIRESSILKTATSQEKRRR